MNQLPVQHLASLSSSSPSSSFFTSSRSVFTASSPLLILTDLSGRLFLVIASNIYILDPVTGKQTGYFLIPNSADHRLGRAGGDLQNQGYFAHDGTLWMIDGNFFDNQTWPAFHDELDGTPLSQGWLDVGPNDGLHSFDSAGFVYFRCSQPAPTLPSLPRWTPTTALPATWASASPPNTSLNVDGVGGYYDFEISISWGSTPEQDMLHGFVWPYQPVYGCQLCRPLVCQSIHSTPYALLDNAVSSPTFTWTRSC